MTSTIPRGKSDKDIESLRRALANYEQEHPKARIALYRQSLASIRIRIIDPSFAGITWADRHELAWAFIEGLPDNIQSQITMLVLLTPAEVKTSFANEEFEHPVPSEP